MEDSEKEGQLTLTPFWSSSSPMEPIPKTTGQPPFANRVALKITFFVEATAFFAALTGAFLAADFALDVVVVPVTALIIWP